jgi:plastocyanin
MRHAIILMAVLTAACGSSEDAPAPVAPAAPAAPASSTVTGVVPRNAIVMLVAAEPVPMPDGPAVMDQYAKQFVPNVLTVRVGQPVEFRNSEDMPHNVTVTRRPTGAEVFNVSTEPQQKHVHTFDRVAQYDVACDIHPGMQATILATETPLATVADDGGRFSVANVKPGTYRLVVTFEGRSVEQPLEVRGAKTEVRLTP